MDRTRPQRPVGEQEDQREAATGLADYAAYVNGGLEWHLRGYVFWLSEHRIPRPDESLPKI